MKNYELVGRKCLLDYNLLLCCLSDKYFIGGKDDFGIINCRVTKSYDSIQHCLSAEFAYEDSDNHCPHYKNCLDRFQSYQIDVPMPDIDTDFISNNVYYR